MSASLTVTPSDPWDGMTPASASPRIDPSTPIQHAIIKANEIDDRPVVIEFRTDSSEKVFPMVPSGKGNDEIVVSQNLDAPNVRPDERIK